MEEYSTTDREKVGIGHSGQADGEPEGEDKRMPSKELLLVRPIQESNQRPEDQPPLKSTKRPSNQVLVKCVFERMFTSLSRIDCKKRLQTPMASRGRSAKKIKASTSLQVDG